MPKIISPSFNPSDGGIQMLSKIYRDFGIEEQLKRPLVMNWKYVFKMKSISYDLVIHGLEFFPNTRAQKIALLLLMKINPPRKIIYVSNFTKTKVETYYPQMRKIRSQVIHNPIVYANSIRSENHKKNKIVLTISRAVPRKNLDVAFTAFSELGLEKFGWQYVYIGSGPLIDKLRTKHKSITFLNNVSEAEKIKWLSQSSIFLHPQIDLGKDFEGYGLAPIEALQFGSIPIIGEQCGLKEGLQNWPLFTNGKIGDVKQKLEVAIADITKYQEIIPKEYENLLRKTNRIKTQNEIKAFLC